MELWSGISLVVDYFRVFGCLAHVHVPDQKRKKPDDKSFPCVLLGVSSESKAYRLFNPITSEQVISSNVVFEEYKGWKWKEKSEETQLIWEGCDDEIEYEDPKQESEEEHVENDTTVFSPEASSSMIEPGNNIEQSPSVISSLHEPDNHAQESRRSTRDKRIPTYLRDYSTEDSPREEESNNVMVDDSTDPSTFD